MKMRTMLATGMIGLGLTAATLLQARGPVSSSAVATSGGALRPASHAVAAEGRVVAYPGGEIAVAAERSGRLVRLLVEEGQGVRKGELLAEIDSSELEASLEEARARIAEAEAEVRLAELSLGRSIGLAEQKILAAHDLDQAQRDLDTARARLLTARATAARYEAQIRQTKILAPISGTITARHTHAGQFIEAGGPLVTIADLKHLRIEGEADEADGAALKPGSAVVITCEAFPGRSWQGQIEEIPTSVTLRRLKPQDPSRPTDARVLAVKVAFLGPSPLKLGTTVELSIEPSP